MLKYIKYLLRTYLSGMRRYANLLKTIYKFECRNIMEIGVFDGIHAKKMIEVAKIFHNAADIHYFGFDLFEQLTDEALEAERSKRPPDSKKVGELLEETGANINLHIGYTVDTLPKFLEQVKTENIKLDLIFIDGGHSLETIAFDWNIAKQLMNDRTIVLLDDYYLNEEPEVEDFGCRSLIDSLDRTKYNVKILKPTDSFRRNFGTLKICMVEVKPLFIAQICKRNDSS